ncbi:magnesium transporter NIPA-domain-containing protein [Gymnopilus junonius]|uniref:Magnesium transporter NIPA-domain-containing protein n=1 Tax=Gymnopilus junonius TaxID=109634 RepID=A0A9P5NU37_GYMJU|nr:magnesium transporter NIPA-domain-containing protein [Gymnopilus junonius]
MEDKYIGLLLALAGSVGIGSSFIITKKGLNDAAVGNAYGAQASDNLSYLRNPIWWLGMVTIANFAAYTFAPPILVTPLGALSVLIGAVLASFLLGEELGHLGRVGCTLCLLGSLIIVLHAPEDKPIRTVDDILEFAIQPGFLLYCLTVVVFTLVMIYKVVPKYGRSNPVIYISICSLVGSVSVMAIKGFGVAVKLTFDGNNQFTHTSTYVFMLVVAISIMVQMNYFNKALDTFSTNVVNPLYYVGFSTCTIVASLILFQGFNTADAANTFSLLTGFIVTFLGVHLLNLSRVPEPPLDHINGQPHSHSALEGGLMNPRLSLQGRMSLDGWNVPADRGMDIHMGGVNAGRPGRHGRQSSLYRAQSTTLFNAFEGPDGDIPAQNGSAVHSQQHIRQPSGDLQQLPEEEWEEDEHAFDRRMLLNKGTRRQQPQRPGSSSPLPPSRHGSRSNSHSPIPDSSLTDVRISPRP